MKRYCLKHGGLFITGFNNLPRGYVLGVYARSAWEANVIGCQVFGDRSLEFIVHDWDDQDKD
jgi:hypothetical protein